MDTSIFYENLKTRLSERIGGAGAQALESLGLLDDEPIVKRGSPLDTVSHYLGKRLQLGNIIKLKIKKLNKIKYYDYVTTATLKINNNFNHP